MTRVPALSLTLLAGALPAAGQDRSVGSELGNVFRDAWFIASSPAHASASDLRGAALAGIGAGIALLLDDAVEDWLNSDPPVTRVLEPFRVSSPASLMGRTWYFLLPLSVGLYGAGHAFASPDLRDAGLGCLTANVTTTLTRGVIALLIGRARPGIGAGPYRFELFAFGDWDHRSFPGGHASNIMSCASYFNHRFDLGIAEPATWALATAVGSARMLDDAHWLSDTVVGMTYGYAVGRGVAARHLARETERSVQPRLHIQWKITF